MILLDINMPIMNGWQFLEAYEQLDETQKDAVIVVMLTSSIDEDDQEKAAIRARAERGMKKLDAQGGAINAINKLRGQAGVDYENDPNMVKTAPGIYRSKSAIKADGHKSFLPNSYEPTLKDEIQDIFERTRYAKEKGKDFKTGKDSKKGGTRDGKSAFDKVSKEMRKTGGLMSSRGKAIQPQGKKKEKGKKGYKGVTPVDKIKNRLAQKRKPKKDPYWSRFD